MLGFDSLTSSAQTSQPTPTATLPPICQNHGGVNCSVLNPDALVVCNDGTVDNSTIIYAVPECHSVLESMANQESDFMDNSGCYPPSEMGCFSEQSYKNLYKILAVSSLSGSMLGKEELAQCRQQITDYSQKTSDYNQCLTDHNQPGFNLSGKTGLPIFKAIFCPIFYGPNTSYNSDADLCVCNKGYFLADGTCTEATQICKSRYGSDSYAQNGNCYQSPSEPANAPIPTPITTPKKIFISPFPRSVQAINPLPTPDVSPRPLEEINIPQKDNSNFITRFFTALTLSVKNVLKLF